MLKHIYRAIILIAIFIAALSYFSGDIKEVAFDIDNTTVMAETTFPLVTIKAGDKTINRLYGYSNNLDANKLREAVTPLNEEQTFEVLIDRKKYDIKKMNYEVREFVQNALIETGSVSVFEDEGEQIKAKIKLQSELTAKKEYAVKITLITSESKKMYFYHRIKKYKEPQLKEKLDFILQFHEALFNKDKSKAYTKYLEPSSASDDTSLAYVNIFSSYELVTWGTLRPSVITEVVPTIKEVYEDIISVELNYIAQAIVSGNTEHYRVTEFYRIRYTQDRIYLLNYERTMDSIFDIGLASLSQSELKMGITNDLEVPYMSGADGRKLAFVRNRELWFYDLEKNEITKVFSFRQEKTDYLRDIYDQHDIRILNMDAEGNLDFMVYGYMNRGQYEGRVAVVLYHFIRAEGRIEEQVYIPIDEPYQSLKENLGELFYVNSKEVFYFQVYNNIYSYSLITRELTEVAADISRKHVVFFSDLGYTVWQENPNPALSDRISILDLESGNKQTISSMSGYNIRLMDKIDSNIIYGYVKEGDIATMMDGSIVVPISQLEIAALDKKILKTYSVPGFYVAGIEVNENIINLRRVQKNDNQGRTLYQPAQTDNIMSQKKSEKSFIEVTDRVTEQALTEYYLKLPSGFTLQDRPSVQTTVNTIIAQDPTVRLPKAEQNVLQYYTYTTGGIDGAYESAADAILLADQKAGVVLDVNNRLVWERGVKASKNTILAFEKLEWTPTEKTIEGSVQLILEYQGVNVRSQGLTLDNSSAYGLLKDYSKYQPVRLTGATLDQVLYYVSKDIPVMAMTDIGRALIIYGFDTFNIMVLDPLENKVRKIGIQDSKQLFENAGNVFLSYLKE